ncbi:DUF1439 domain-containing protein [Desulfurobacterium sp.]
MKKLIALFILGAVLIFSCIPEPPAPFYTITVTANQIETQLKRKFPIIVDSNSFTISLKNPEVDIKSNRIYTGMAVKIKTPLSLSLSGRVYVSGTVKYEPSTGKIYLVNPAIEELAINGKIVISGKVPAIKEVVNDVIRTTFKKIPLYQVNAKYRTNVKAIKISGNRLVIKVKLF